MLASIWVNLNWGPTPEELTIKMFQFDCIRIGFYFFLFGFWGFYLYKLFNHVTIIRYCEYLSDIWQRNQNFFFEGSVELEALDSCNL